MKLRFFLLPLISMLAECMLLQADDSLDQQRVWTSEDQRSIEAKLLDADADKRTAKLRRKDGYTFTIEWNMLSAADQAALQNWTDARRQPVSTPTTSSKPPEELPPKVRAQEGPDDQTELQLLRAGIRQYDCRLSRHRDRPERTCKAQLV